MESFSSYMFYYGIQHSPLPPTLYVAASNALLFARAAHCLQHNTQRFALPLVYGSATDLKTQLELPSNQLNAPSSSTRLLLLGFFFWQDATSPCPVNKRI